MIHFVLVSLWAIFTVLSPAASDYEDAKVNDHGYYCVVDCPGKVNR